MLSGGHRRGRSPRFHDMPPDYDGGTLLDELIKQILVVETSRVGVAQERGARNTLREGAPWMQPHNVARLQSCAASRVSARLRRNPPDHICFNPFARAAAAVKRGNAMTDAEKQPLPPTMIPADRARHREKCARTLKRP